MKLIARHWSYFADKQIRSSTRISELHTKTEARDVSILAANLTSKLLLIPNHIKKKIIPQSLNKNYLYCNFDRFPRTHSIGNYSAFCLCPSLEMLPTRPFNETRMISHECACTCPTRSTRSICRASKSINFISSKMMMIVITIIFCT